MAKEKQSLWVTLLSGGLGVAILTFVANKAWESYQHQTLGPKHVATSLRFEDNKLLLFVRNNSDEPLDLVQAEIYVDASELLQDPVLGAYPDITKVYEAKATSGTAQIEQQKDQIVLRVKIIQAIAPRGADQFGVGLLGAAGPVDLSKIKLKVELEDIRGNHYAVAP